MNTVIWLRRAFNCLILCLLVCNLAYLTKNYLRYWTQSNVAPSFPVRLNATKLSLCFSISSLLDRSPQGYSFSSDRNIKYINWTFYEVFKRMPSASSTLDSCKYRDFDLDILREEKDGKKCAELFKVIRYRMQGYMCYRFTFPFEQEYSYHRLINSLYSPRELYHLSVAQPLSDEHILYPLLHFSEFPNDDRVFNGEVYHGSGSLFQLSYDLIESSSSPAPYSTRCARESRFTCYQKCMADVQRRLGYSPDSDVTMENSSASSLRLMPTLEVNAEPDRLFCYKQCPRYACKQVLVNTRANKVDNSDEKLLFAVETLNRPITKSEYLPQFPLIDYITQVGAVVSIWTGISVITLSRLIQPRRKVALKTFFLAVKSHFTAVRLILSTRQSRNVRDDVFSIEKKKLVTKLKRRSILAYLFRVSLLPVLSGQLFNVVHHYFLFQTTSEFHFVLDPKLNIPTLGFCFDYKDVLSIHAIRPTEANYHELFLARESMFNITLQQMLGSNAATDELIDGCYLRHWKSRFKWFRYKNGSECLEHFSVKKFFSNNKLCYKMQARKLGPRTPQSDIKLLLTNSGIIYAIILTSKVHLPEKLYVFTKFVETSSSFEFPVRIYKSDMQNMISLSDQVYYLYMLPAPFDTYCDETWGREKCLEACTSKALSRYNRLPYEITENRTLDMRFLSYLDLLNDSVNEMWRRTEVLCDKKCWRSSCEVTLTMTFLERRFPVKGLQNIFAIDLHSHPLVNIDVLPVMNRYQLMYEILCCFSFWLGVSLIDLKPPSALMQRRMKMNIYLTQMYVVVDKVVNRLLRIGLWSSYVQSVQGLGRRKLLNFFFRSSVMGLCFCHIIYSMLTYMLYSSFIDVYQKMETRTDVSLHICLDSAELIGRKFPSVIKDPLVARSVIMNRTITSLFADTPREDELIQQCGYRGLHSRMANLSHLDHVSDRIFFFTKNKAICDQVYEVHKFIVQSYMCYSVRPRHYTGWNTFQMKHGLNRPDMISLVAINSSLLTKRFSLLVDFERYFPLTSSTFAENILRDSNYGFYEVSYIRYIQRKLPSPRTTNGFVPFQYDGCLRQCVNERFKRFNLTLSERFTGPSNLRFVSCMHRRSNTFKIPFRQIQNQCEMGCLEYNGQALLGNTKEFTFFVPIVNRIRKHGRTKTNLTPISLKITNQPVIVVTFILKISLFQQIINLGSILGLWFGFSAVTLARMGRIRDKEVGPEELLSQKQHIRTLRAKYSIRL